MDTGPAPTAPFNPAAAADVLLSWFGGDATAVITALTMTRAALAVDGELTNTVQYQIDTLRAELDTRR